MPKNGESVTVIARRIEDHDCGVISDSARMYPHLIGKVGIVLDYEDDAYNTNYPTGHERAYYDIQFPHGVETVDSAFVRKV